jgi:hypothetical protein
MNHNNQKQMNVFFYSKFSAMCTDLLKMMDSYKIINQFLLRCVDDMVQLPPGLERVPTLIVIGIEKPLVAKEAMTWFDGMRPIFLQQSSDTLNKQIMNGIMRNGMQSIQGPKGYANGEYDGISDSFAYTDVDMAQPKTFCEYGNDKDAIYTPPKDDTKINKQEQDRSIREMEQERKQQETEYANIMKRGQVEAVMYRERNQLMKERLGI